MGIYAFTISFFIISWALIFGICIDYWSAASIRIRRVLYLKRTLELLISTLILTFCCLLGFGKKNLKYNKDQMCQFVVYS